MSKPIINAQEALDLLNQGKSDSDIMARFKLSMHGLQSLFTKLIAAGLVHENDLDKRFPNKSEFVTISQETNSDDEIESPKPVRKKKVREIKAAELLKDIQAGLKDHDIMDKYRLSAKGFRSIIDQLLKAKLISQPEMDSRIVANEETVDLLGIMRKLGLDNTAAKKEPQIPLECIACGAPQTVEFEECPVCGVNIKEYKVKKAYKERIAASVWKCPACGKPQDRVYDECPVCGIVIAKIQKLNSTNTGEAPEL
jgi:hypothetical protein